jgi:hypothetical protein
MFPQHTEWLTINISIKNLHDSVNFRYPPPALGACKIFEIILRKLIVTSQDALCSMWGVIISGGKKKVKLSP